MLLLGLIAHHVNVGLCLYDKSVVIPGQIAGSLGGIGHGLPDAVHALAHLG